MIAKNIVDGKSIFGINGTAKTGPSAIGELLKKYPLYKLILGTSLSFDSKRYIGKINTVSLPTDNSTLFTLTNPKIMGNHSIRIHIIDRDTVLVDYGDFNRYMYNIPTKIKIEFPKNLIFLYKIPSASASGYGGAHSHSASLHTEPGYFYLPNSTYSISIPVNGILSISSDNLFDNSYITQELELYNYSYSESCQCNYGTFYMMFDESVSEFYE